ncbi:RNA-binding cell elongation regulator Jag/EloR [Thomasclavelia spiroformis]|uniref:RNA-binding cell elongation regulator Jag/EloR n=1 Tax=Thomasclavelia spiroformis TaxID=29348 RepID=UPI00294392E2|nr:RNA-binding cell elongation regulator Jag/EloR [Thomasclavelia spiroformis]
MFKRFTAKTVQDAVNLACQELNVTVDELNYEVISETKTFFTKRAEIECYTIAMVQEYIEGYVRRFISEMGFEVETVSYLQDGRIYCNINTSNNSILIGKAGVILRAINFIVKNAVSTTYKKRIELSVDINGYKEERYKKVASMARKLGKQVLRTKADIKLDPMPADERKVMHQELAKLDHVKTQSYGEGKNRHMVISYIE